MAETGERDVQIKSEIAKWRKLAKVARLELQQ